MSKIYTLVHEPRGELYSKLLFYSLKICNSFILVIRPTVAIKNSAKNVIDELKPYLIEKSAQSEWPGTKLIDGEALVYYFQLNEGSVKYLLHISESLYSWLHPDLPEDLCLLRPDKTPWLVTIPYERDGYFEITEEERGELQESIPELIVSGDKISKVD